MDVLPLSDCYSKIRADLIEEEENITYSKTLCLSLAWDWMFKGISSEGINREILSILEYAKLNRQNNAITLAIPETYLLQMAISFPREIRQMA